MEAARPPKGGGPGDVRVQTCPSLLDHLEVAQRLLAQRPSALFSDVDGTLSPIVPSPEQATVPESIRRALQRLAGRLDMVVAISGRPAQEARRLVGLQELAYVGNHGLEVWQGGRVRVEAQAAPFLPLMARVVARLGPELERLPGVRLEPKGITASIHYRQSPHSEVARAAILAAVGRLSQARRLRVTEGRMVVNLVPALELNKGSATLALVRRHGLRAVLYLGDDTTDVDAFAALRSLRAEGVGTLAVAVLSLESPPGLLELADYHVPGVQGVERALAALGENGAGLALSLD